jgi:hypothetical protein
LELDWTGQFRSEFNFIKNYTLDSSDSGPAYDPNRGTAGGYYVPGGGSNDATYETLFLKLKPKLVVNDNIYIKSEFWVGNPIFGMFGDSAPSSIDQRYYNSVFSGGSLITAQRFWAEFLSDIGTVQIGRAPLHWGLGVIWNSGDGLWDRYESTGDTIRLVSKFGAFSFIPAFTVYNTGNSVGGSCIGGGGGPYGCAPGLGSGGVTDYSVAIKYDNPDEDFEVGVNFIKRLEGPDQDPNGGFVGPQGVVGSANYNTWDIYARKRIGKFTLAGEFPIQNGLIGGDGTNYAAFALAAELGWRPSDTWESQLKLGHVPGQPNLSNPAIDTYREIFLNPAYRLGLIMFNFQLANFAGPNTLNSSQTAGSQLRSPYDNPITNADYLAFFENIHLDKWTIRPAFIWAVANQTCSSGNYCFNTWSKQMVLAQDNQSSSLGWELDVGATYQWDDFFQFKIDTGIWVPGAYYQFSNAVNGAGGAPIENATSPVFAISLGAGVNF